tara:strand:+ start:510 stop:620 length:111 start_codon:yes stop_codon:yes gene_type:complete
MQDLYREQLAGPRVLVLVLAAWTVAITATLAIIIIT